MFHCRYSVIVKAYACDSRHSSLLPWLLPFKITDILICAYILHFFLSYSKWDVPILGETSVIARKLCFLGPILICGVELF